MRCFSFSLCLRICITVLFFWLFDIFMHSLGVGETHFYYISKFANASLFALLWFLAFDAHSWQKRFGYSFIFGTWISFYYLVSAYSGLVQWLGLTARYAAPPFVFGDLYLSPFLWWVFHSLAFYLGLELAGLVNR